MGVVHAPPPSVPTDQGRPRDGITGRHSIEHPPRLLQLAVIDVHVHEVVLRDDNVAVPELEDVGVELFTLLRSAGDAAGAEEGGEGEVVGAEVAVEHFGVEVEEDGEADVDISAGRHEIAIEDGIVEEDVGFGNAVEHLESVVQVAMMMIMELLLSVKAQLLDNPADGVVVGGEAEADDLGVELLELGHRRTRVECIVQVGVPTTTDLVLVVVLEEEHMRRHHPR